MKLARKAGSLVLAAAAAVGMTLVPAASAQARPVPMCPAVVGACTWSNAAYEGVLRVFYDAEPTALTPVRSVSNQDVQAWCFYEQPFFGTQGTMREVAAGSAVRDLGFDARSAQQGQCQEQEA